MNELHPRITIVTLVRRLKWLLNNQNSSADLHPSKIKIINNTIELVESQNSIEDAYNIFMRSFTWHPLGTSPVEVQFEKEYNEVIGPEIVKKYCPEIYSKDRTDDEFMIKDIIYGRPLNRLVMDGNKSILTPIPVVHAETPRFTLEELCEERAEEFKELSKENDIYLMWSGGIDSTLVLHALNNANVPFRLVMDNDTVDEYTELSNTIIDGGWPNVIEVCFDVSTLQYKAIIDNPKNIIISGGNGDEIFGGEPGCAGELKNADQEYTFYIPQDIYEHTDPYVLQLLEPLYTKDILLGMTVCEWRWAVNFIYRYQQIQISSMYMLGMDITHTYNKHRGYHFYDTTGFNIWAIQNFEALCGAGVGEDKMIAKDLIYKYDGNDWFHTAKKKVCSMKKTKYRTGHDYIGTGGDVNSSIGKKKNLTYESTINTSNNQRLLKPGHNYLPSRYKTK
jgi:hypothetical protein